MAKINRESHSTVNSWSTQTSPTWCDMKNLQNILRWIYLLAGERSGDNFSFDYYLAWNIGMNESMAFPSNILYFIVLMHYGILCGIGDGLWSIKCIVYCTIGVQCTANVDGYFYFSHEYLISDWRRFVIKIFWSTWPFSKTYNWLGYGDELGDCIRHATLSHLWPIRFSTMLVLLLLYCDQSQWTLACIFFLCYLRLPPFCARSIDAIYGFMKSKLAASGNIQNDKRLWKYSW